MDFAPAGNVREALHTRDSSRSRKRHASWCQPSNRTFRVKRADRPILERELSALAAIRPTGKIDSDAGGRILRREEGGVFRQRPAGIPCQRLAHLPRWAGSADRTSSRGRSGSAAGYARDQRGEEKAAWLPSVKALVFSEKRQKEEGKTWLASLFRNKVCIKRTQSCKILPRVSLTPRRSPSVYERKQPVPYSCSPFVANDSGMLEKSCRCFRAIIHSLTGKRNYSHSGHPILVVHTIQLLDASIRGAPLDTLR